jgi:hypothetical protein
MVLLSAVGKVKCFLFHLLLGSLIAVYCFKQENFLIKQYSLHSFVYFVFLCKKDIFLHTSIIHMSTFPSYLHISILSRMYPCVFPVFSKCCAQVDVSLLYFIARIFLLNRVLNERPV